MKNEEMKEEKEGRRGHTGVGVRRHLHQPMRTQGRSAGTHGLRMNFINSPTC